jgi:hypothetical protein
MRIPAVVGGLPHWNYAVIAQQSFERAHEMKTGGNPRTYMKATADRSRPPVRPWLGAIVLAIGVCIGGCSDKGQDSSSVKTTSYQGKPDTAPWDGPRWHGERENWERAIDARAQNQNEYVRIP